jgi:hypothetical protein
MIAWTKKKKNGNHECKHSCVELNGLQHWKLKTLVNTRFASKMITFEKALNFKKAILLCYGLSSTMFLQQNIPKS